MQRTPLADAIQPKDQQQLRAGTEQPLTHPRGALERLFERKTSVNKTNLSLPNRDAYVSDIVNVQSLLNIRAAESRRRPRVNSQSFQDRIIINVCGDRYETHRNTLELYPDTLLGNRRRRKYYFDKSRNEYFFDRNRACFEAILYYYQSRGRLRRPNYVSIDVFLEEVTFFQLGKVALDQLRKDENIEEVKKIQLPKNRYRKQLWATMEYPDYSIAAKLVNILSLLMILTSTIVLAVETLPQYSGMDSALCRKEQPAGNATDANVTAGHLPMCEAYFTTPFFIIQTICIVFFTIELLLRIISAPSVLIYVKSVMNWIDLFAVVPYYFVIVIHVIGQQEEAYTTTYVILRFIRIIRFVRIFKFYRVFKNVKSLRVLTATMKQSIPDFFVMIVILTLTSFLFGAAAYFAEHDTNGQAFDSILKATYWGVMTITSVGYGDISPITPIGRVIACLCALCGAATIGMLVSVLVDRYQRVYARKLYINEETVDFHDESDAENNESDSRKNSGQLSRRNQSKVAEDPNVRTKENAAFEQDEGNTDDTVQIIPSPNVDNLVPTPIHKTNSRVHSIIGFVDDENHEASLDLLETLRSIVAHRQAMGENIHLNIVSDRSALPQRLSPYDVKFKISVSSDESDDEELTEIVMGCGNKGNVLKRFQAPPSPEVDRRSAKADEHVQNIL